MFPVPTILATIKLWTRNYEHDLGLTMDQVESIKDWYAAMTGQTPGDYRPTSFEFLDALRELNEATNPLLNVDPMVLHRARVKAQKLIGQHGCKP